MTTRIRVTLSSLLLFLLLLAFAAGPAAATEPWWSLNTSIRPAVIDQGAEAKIFVRAVNIGNACTPSAGPGEDGTLCTADDEGIVPTTLTATLPEGMEIVEEGGEPDVSIFAFYKGAQPVPNASGHCSVSGRQISCATDVSQAYIQHAVEEILEEEPFKAIIEAEPEFCAPCRPFLEAIFQPAIEEQNPPVPPLAPFEYFEMRVRVRDVSAAAGAAYSAEASGGGATPVSRTRLLSLGVGAPSFGTEDYALRPEAEGGGLDSRAGAHPYQLTTTFNLNQNGDEAPAGAPEEQYEHPPALVRNLRFRLPPGQIGNAAAVPRCSADDFSTLVPGFPNLCPPDTAIGVAVVSVYEPAHLGHVTVPVPLFNLEPAFGEPARFGFDLLATPVILDTTVRSGPGEDYGVTVSTSNTSQLANVIASTVTFWGVPGDPSHNSARGWSCLVKGHYNEEGTTLPPCEPENAQKPVAFLTLPTDCNAPFATDVSGESWSSLTTPEQSFDPFLYSLEEGGSPTSLIGCNQLPFAPQIHSEPTSNSATSPTGISFDISFEDEGLLSSKPGARAQSQMKRAVVTLPQGFTTNPSVAEGLKACSQAEYEAATPEPNSGCTPESKIGEVEVTSPLLQPDQVLHGGLYVATQHDNPNHNLLTLYLVARNAEIGTIVKEALKVTPDPVTGQLTTEVDNVPELPFSHVHLAFRQGQRSPLITPPACGPYTVKALLYPWSNPDAPVERTSSFEISQGPEGQPCPSGGLPPFHPELEAGTKNNAAGTYSPFYARISRKDSEQEITHFSIKLPPGVSGKLAGVAKCSDGQIAAAKAREHEGGGQEELDSPSCPAGSEIGHTLVGTGVGNVLAYAPGKLYLAGPYHGAPISIVSVTAAKVGPFDLGTVVVREALKVNSETAEVFVDATGSDPIPHIVDGIPTHLRDIRIYVDRPEFVLNPTGCERTSTASTVLGSGLDFVSEADDNPVTVSSPFQAADCAALGFKPKLTLALKGGTKRSQVPALKATLTARKGDANIARSEVILPHSEFLEQNHLGSTCTRVQYNEGAGHGAGCPANSLIGRARAVTPILSEPLEGMVYLRSNGSERKLPDLVAALKSQEINIDLVGFIDSVREKNSKGETISKIRNRFQAVPDAPVEKFTLELYGGKKGLLVNSTNLCQGKHNAKVNFTAHNGRIEEFISALKTSCPKKHGKRSKKKRG
jgi:hypothetical protein